MTTTKRALITGITGQDGSYLAELLLAKGYEVHGIVRRSSSFNTSRIEGIYQDPHAAKPRLRLHYGDLCDSNSLSDIMRRVRPHEVYNLGAQSHVRVSFDMPIYTAETVAMGALKLLEADEQGDHAAVQSILAGLGFLSLEEFTGIKIQASGWANQTGDIPN